MNKASWTEACQMRTKQVHRSGASALSFALAPCHKDLPHVSVAPSPGGKLLDGQGPGQGPGRRLGADRPRLRQGLDNAAWQGSAAGRDRHGLLRLARARHRARRRRPAARPRRRDLRPRILRQDHARPLHRRRGPEGRRHLRLHRRRARARSDLRPQARGGARRPSDLAAGHRRAGAGDLRHPGALRAPSTCWSSIRSPR